MKFKLVLLTVGLLLALNSCILVDANGKFGDDEGFISLTIKSPSNNRNITEGERLDIKIIAEDDDGIKKITLKIPNLYVDKVFNSSKSNLEINDVFIIQKEDIKGVADIIVKLYDEDGNITKKTGSIIIK